MMEGSPLPRYNDEMFKKISPLEETLAWQIKVAQLPPPQREYKFCPQRKWRADFAWPTVSLLVEVEGGVHKIGRHQRPTGFEKDCEKYNWAVMHNWKILRFTNSTIKTGVALQMIEKVLIGENNVGR